MKRYSLLECLIKEHGKDNSAMKNNANRAYQNYCQFMKNDIRTADQFEFMFRAFGYQSFLRPIDSIVRVGKRIGIVRDYHIHGYGWTMFVECSDGSYDVSYEDTISAQFPDNLVKIIEKRCMDEIIKRYMDEIIRS